MTNKIIIDGVNVAKCKHYKDGECACYYKAQCGYEITGFDLCIKHRNCYYKQVKEKDLRVTLGEIKKENEELKETIRAYQEDRFCQGGCAIYQYDKIHELTQALDEIEKMVRNYDDWDLHKDILDIINNAKEE